MSPKNNPRSNFVFQAAIGRSGSTLLRTSIGLHPEVYYNGKENNHIQDLLSVAERNCAEGSRAFSMVVDQESYDAAFRNLICQLTWPDQKLATRQIHFAAINPTEENLNTLLRLFPSMKVVCNVRNGIEVVVSRLKYRSFKELEFKSHCQTWRRYSEMLDWGEKNPGRFFLFRHEWSYDQSLVEEKLGALFDWMGVEDSSEVVENFSKPPQSSATSELQKPFSEMSATEKQTYFRDKVLESKKWSSQQQSEFVRICGDQMKRLGFQIPFDG